LPARPPTQRPKRSTKRGPGGPKTSDTRKRFEWSGRTIVSIVGIIANPVSARDIRRVVANASNLQTSERVNIVLRLLSTLASLGVSKVLMMPDKAGMRTLLKRQLGRETPGGSRFPAVEFLDFDPGTSVEDTFTATRMLRDAGVQAIVVLGGDGTHRAVARDCGSIPIAGLSTGTNNAFPDMREPTICALAVGLYVSGKLSPADALSPNKMIEVVINNGERHDIAIVDAVIARERVIGSRALWKTESLAAIYLTYADPEAIGLSAIGGLLHPVSRRSNEGLGIALAAPGESASQTPEPIAKPATGSSGSHASGSENAAIRLLAPIAPGMLREVTVARWWPLKAGVVQHVALGAGVVALDGEREMTFDHADQLHLSLRTEAFYTIDVPRCLRLAAERGLLRC